MTNSFKQIDIHQAKSMLDQVVLVDIRDEASYQQAHISGALALSDQNIQEFLSNTPRNKPVICYCYHGISSQNAANFLVEQGFEDVYSLIGGFEEWRRHYEGR
jgi:thiosulfate sulfurtransferase